MYCTENDRFNKFNYYKSNFKDMTEKFKNYKMGPLLSWTKYLVSLKVIIPEFDPQSNFLLDVFLLTGLYNPQNFYGQIELYYNFEFTIEQNLENQYFEEYTVDLEGMDSIYS